jgi:hypothetical protein
MEEADDEIACADCGTRVSVSRGDICFAFGTEGALCLTCASRRGGAYDVADDRWVVAPWIDDLLGRPDLYAP